MCDRVGVGSSSIIIHVAPNIGHGGTRFCMEWISDELFQVGGIESVDRFQQTGSRLLGKPGIRQSILRMAMETSKVVNRGQALDKRTDLFVTFLGAS